jgi:hypothetical protein
MPYPQTVQIRDFKRKNAEERQAAYAKLSWQEKFDKLPPEPAGAKVRAKLMKLKEVKLPEAKVEIVKEIEVAVEKPVKASKKK